VSDREHWEAAYGGAGAAGVSWFRPRLDRSLALLERARIGPAAAVIDVGGGASTFVDDLLDRGFTRVTVLDVSATALAAARARLGARAARVEWIEAAVEDAPLAAGAYDVWHDRALFHFLVAAEDRRRYLEALHGALAAGGHVLIASFGPHGPQRCSGLPVARYDAAAMLAELGPEYRLVADAVEIHRTPSGGEQEFAYCLARRDG
jgi:SAM-dependent methyltransferase